MATFVDPRFKAILFGTEDQRNKVIGWTVDTMVAAVNSPKTQPTLPSLSSSTSSAVVTPAKKSIFDKLDRVKLTCSPTAAREDTQQARRHEIREYMDADTIDRNSCPLD